MGRPFAFLGRLLNGRQIVALDDFLQFLNSGLCRRLNLGIGLVAEIDDGLFGLVSPLIAPFIYTLF